MSNKNILQAKGLHLAIVFFALLFIAPTYAKTAWSTPSASGSNDMHLYLYWSKDCPHCKVAVPYMNKMAKKYPWLKLHSKEITNSKKNVNEFARRANEIGEQAEVVPSFIFCGQMYSGYGDNETTGKWIIDTLAECKTDPAGYLKKYNLQ